MTITEPKTENKRTSKMICDRLDELVERFKGKSMYMDRAFHLTRKGPIIVDIMSEEDVSLIFAIDNNAQMPERFWKNHSDGKFVDAEEYFTNMKNNVISVLGPPIEEEPVRNSVWKNYVVRVHYDYTESPNSPLGKGFNDISVKARNEEEATKKAVRGKGYIAGLRFEIVSVK